MPGLKVLHQKNLFLYLALFLLAFIPRVYLLGEHSLFIDELLWLVRGKDLVFAIKHANLSFLKSGWWDFSVTRPVGIPAAFLIGFFELAFARGQSEMTLNLTNEVIAGRFPIAVLGALSSVLFYFLIKKLFSQKIALLSFFLLAFDPVHIGLSRWAHQDVALTLFFLTSILFFVLAEKEGNQKLKIISAISFSFAFLTKPNGVLILPILFVWKVYSKRKKIFAGKFKQIFSKSDFAWATIGLSLIIFLWPITWSNPLLQLWHYFFTQQAAVEAGHLNFFLGKITYDPGLLYYPTILAIRLPEITILGIVLGFIFSLREFLKKKVNDNSIILALWFIAVFGLMTLSPKKLEVRYILPAYPPLLVFSAWGLSRGLSEIKNKVFQKIGVIFIPLFLILILVRFAPNYYLYYNHLVGGPAGASEITLLDPGCGIKPAVQKVIEDYGPETKISILGYYQTAQYATPYPLNLVDWSEADIVIIEQQILIRTPNHPGIIWAQKEKPVSVIKLKGAEVAWIYKKD